MNEEFNPTLAYLYRRWLVRKLLRSDAHGRFLEIGVGSGNLYKELASQGLSGICVDLNLSLIQGHRSRSKDLKGIVEFRAMDFFQLEDSFDLILAFEVLEHYVDDRQCLERWWQLLKPHGVLLFSVPAHKRCWTANDSQAGHARRYEKDELLNKLTASRFVVDNCWCYGYPILNWTYPLSGILFPGKATAHNSEVSAYPAGQSASVTSNVVIKDYIKTRESGTRNFPRLSKWLLREWLWRPLLLVQQPFLDRDLGIGYIVKCRKATVDIGKLPVL